MSGRAQLLARLDEAETALEAGRTRIARRRLRDARALVVLLVPATPTVCPECELGAGLHVEGCSQAPLATETRP